MDRLVLAKAVTVKGKSFLGPSASVTFAPHPTGEPGWWWNVGTLEKPNLQPITPENILLGKNSIIFAWRKREVRAELKPFVSLFREFGYSYVVYIVEHLLALRGSGLDSVVIFAPEKRLPYDGCAALFWDAIKPHLRKEGSVCWMRLPPVPAPLEHLDRHLSCAPYGKNPGLAIDIEIDYGSGIELRQTFVWSLELFEQVVRAKTLGYPHGLKLLARLAHFGGWPHFDHIMWRDRDNPQGDALTIAHHRLLDIMGEMAATQPAGCLLGGHIRSIWSGHLHGLALMRAVAKEWHSYNRRYAT